MITLLISSCTAPPPPPVSPPAKPWTAGEVRKGSFGSYKKLHYEADGWRVWEASHQGGLVHCVAVKPSIDGTKTNVTYLGMVSGGPGFKMGFTEYSDEPFLMFYGAKYSLASIVLEVDGIVMTSTDDKSTVLSWEGKSVNFEVATGSNGGRVYDYSTTEDVRESGTMDFTGVTKSFEAVNRCISHVRIDKV